MPYLAGFTAGKNVNDYKKKAKAKKNINQSGTQPEETVKASTPYPGKQERKPTLSTIEASPSKPRRKKPRTRAATATNSTPKKYEEGVPTPVSQPSQKKKRKRRARP